MVTCDGDVNLHIDTTWFEWNETSGTCIGYTLGEIVC